MSLKVAAAQMGPALENKGDNVARVESLLARAKDAGADLVVFPELALSPYFANSLDEDTAQWVDDTEASAHVAQISGTVKRLGLVCILPLAQICGEDLFNSALVIDSDGTLLGTYQKAHIPGRRSATGEGISGEALYFTPGPSGFEVFTTAVGRVGVLICADRGYPEAWRVLALRGAQIVAAPFNTSDESPFISARARLDDESPFSSARARMDEIRRIQQLRMSAEALNNGYFVVAAGKAGVERGVEYVADSQILDPWGRVRARASTDGDEIVVAEVDLESELRERDARRHLRSRRPELYGALAADLG